MQHAASNKSETLCNWFWYPWTGLSPTIEKSKIQNSIRPKNDFLALTKADLILKAFPFKYISSLCKYQLLLDGAIHILPVFTVVENGRGIGVVDVKENVLCSIVIEVLQDENVAILRGHIQVEEETRL